MRQSSQRKRVRQNIKFDDEEMFRVQKAPKENPQCFEGVFHQIKVKAADEQIMQSITANTDGNLLRNLLLSSEVDN